MRAAHLSSRRRPTAIIVLVGALVLGTAALILLIDPAQPRVRTPGEPPVLVLVIAVALAALHLAGPRLRQVFSGNETLVRSLGEGLASAYVFLMLIPELEGGHEFLGDAIHVVVLFGFLVFLALEIRSQQRGPDASEVSHARAFRYHLGGHLRAP